MNIENDARVTRRHFFNRCSMGIGSIACLAAGNMDNAAKPCNPRRSGALSGSEKSSSWRADCRSSTRA
jgi:hypothetical protein